MKSEFLRKLLVGPLMVVLFLLGNIAAKGSSQKYSFDQLVPYDDQTKTEVYTLANNLQVLLRSNPNRTKSSVALSVGVGSLNELSDKPGMAHFLEHLLFLGTETYPEIDGYNKFIKAAQGSNNAYTSKTETNYHFDIHPDQLAEGIDRFAHFFIDPSFNKEFVQKEKSAIEGEFNGILDNRGWIDMLLGYRLLDKDHPLHRYHPGSEASLKVVTREDVIEFFNKNYSAQNMKLVVDSNHTIEELKNLVTPLFSKIVDRGDKVQHFDRPKFSQHPTPFLLAWKSKKQEKILKLKFLTNSMNSYWKSKPGHLISHILGHEGEGSLLSSLKKDNLATALMSGHSEMDFAGEFGVTIVLTEKGIGEVKEIVQRLLAMVEMIKQANFSSIKDKAYIFNELQVSQLNSYLFTQTNYNQDLDYAVALASQMHHTPAQYILPRQSLIYDFEQEGLDALLSEINFNNMVAILSHPDVKGDKKDEELEVEYNLTQLSAKDFELNQTYPELSLPSPNPYIKEVQALSNTRVQKEMKPVNIMPSWWGSLWYQWDHVTGKPKSKLSIRLSHPMMKKNPANHALATLYTMAFNEQVNEWKYMVDLSSTSFTVEKSDLGLNITVEGYNQSLLKVLSDLAKRVNTRLTLSEERLDSLKNSYKSSILSGRFNSPLRQTVSRLKSNIFAWSLNNDEIFNPDQNVDFISNISLSDLNKFRENFFYQVMVKGAYFGQINDQQLQKAVIHFLTQIEASPLPKSMWVDTKVSASNNHDHVIRNGIKQSAYGQWIPLGKKEARNEALTLMAESFLSADFFSTLRTQGEMSYSLHASPFPMMNELGFVLLMESPSHNPESIKKEFTKWKNEVLERFQSEMDDESWAMTKAALISELMEKPNTLNELWNELYMGAYYMDGVFDHDQKVAEEVEKLSINDVFKFYQEHFQKGDKSYTEVSITK